MDGAEIRAKLIYGSSGVGVAKGVDFANGNVTSSALSAKADSKSSARAAALGADSDAGAYVRYSDSAKVVLEGDSLTEGDAVVLRASHENVDLKADAGASCSCGGGDTDATARVIFHLDSLVQADDSSVVRTANLLVEALEFVGYYYRAHRSGGFLDVGGSSGSATVDPKRTIVWNADVYLLGEPNPRLVVDATGKIIAKSDNVTVRANGVGPALQIDDVFAPGTTIVIDPIIYDQKPTALFRANHHDDVASTISGTLGIFFMQETWNSVTVLNGSDRPMQLLGTGGAPERVDQHAQLVDVLVARSDHQRLGRRRRGGCGRPPVAVRRQAHLPGDSRPDREHPRSAVPDSVLRRCLQPHDLRRHLQHRRHDDHPERPRRHPRGAGRADLLLQQGVPRLRARLDRHDPDPDPARPLPDHPHRRARRPGHLQGRGAGRRGRPEHLPRADGAPPLLDDRVVRATSRRTSAR